MDETKTEIVVDPEAVSAEVVETQQPEQIAEAQAQAPAEQPKPDNEEVKAKRRSFEERIAKITRRAHEERERADEMTRKYNALVQEVQSKPLQREAFADDQTYLAAVDRQRTRLTALEVQAELAIDGARSVGAQHQQAVVDAWTAAIADVVETIPDWHAVVSASKAPTTPVMDQAIMENENGPEIAYYLAKHPAEALRIYQLSPKAQEREIVRLESKVSTVAPTSKPSAPAPIKPIPAAVKAVTSQADEFRQWEAEQNKINRFGAPRR